MVTADLCKMEGIPKVKLNNGLEMPGFGLGTYMVSIYSDFFLLKSVSVERVYSNIAWYPHIVI